MRSVPGEYHGFLWFYFMNEQVLRFLNLRYPRDYNTVPRLYFWLFHLIWLFPWSVYFPAVARLSFKPLDRAGRTRLLALCWTGFLLVFFTFSTTQEYYSMPCYPALALLLGSAMAAGGDWVRRGTRVLAAVAGMRGAGGRAPSWWRCATCPRPGDISQALSQHPGAYTLSLGPHGRPDARIVRLPAAAAGAGGRGVPDRRAGQPARGGAARVSGRRVDDGAVFPCGAAGHGGVRSVSFVAPAGRSAAAIARRETWWWTITTTRFPRSSFTPNRTAWLLNGRFNNLVYGSYAPGAPDVFLTDAQWKDRWLGPRRYYLVAKTSRAAAV